MSPPRRAFSAPGVTATGFALLSTVLGGIGLFGVVAHDFASRRAELALRLALGADPQRISKGTLGPAGWLVGVGLAVGRALSTRAPHALVFAAGRFDPSMSVILLAGAAAALPAALRAARTGRVGALRGD